MKTVSDLTSIISPGDIFIDCGANVGQETVPMAEAGAIVYAFEPNPFAFETLKSKVGYLANVHLLNKGVYDHNGSMKLYFHENSDDDEVYWSTGSSFLEVKSNVRNDKFKEIEIIDLSGFMKSLNKRVKVLKIDVEGVEAPIVNSLIDNHITELVDYIFVETHEKKIPEIAEEVESLKEKVENLKITNIDFNWI